MYDARGEIKMKNNKDVVNVQIKMPKKLAKKMKVYLAQNDMTWSDFLMKPILKLFPGDK